MERMKTGEGVGKEPKKKCGACQEDLVILAFSKKQWQLKSQRRCKDCIAGSMLEMMCHVGDHENDVTTAQFKLLMNGGIPEWESEQLVAFIHVVHRFKKCITDPSSIKKCNKVLEALPTVIMAALIKRYEVGLQNLNKLYRLSIEQKISLPRFLGEIEKDWKTINKYIAQNGFGASRHEMLLEWMTLTEEGLNLISIVEKQVHNDEQLLRPLIDAERGEASSMMWLLSSEKEQKAIPPSIDQGRGDISIKEPHTSAHYSRYHQETGIRLNPRPQTLSQLQRAFQRHLEIHGFDVSWMTSIIGLRLRVPEWWLRGENGGRYSKSIKVWEGQIVDVCLPDDSLGSYVDAYGSYFLFKCDKEDDNKYSMRYFHVFIFAIGNQDFVLPYKMPVKYVDKQLHLLCLQAKRQMAKLQMASEICLNVLPAEGIQSVLEYLEMGVVVTEDADNILQRAIQLANEGLEKRHMIADDIRNLTSDDILNLANDEFWQQLSRKEGEDMGFDKTEIALKFEKGFTELCESHAAQRVGDYIDRVIWRSLP